MRHAVIIGAVAVAVLGGCSDPASTPEPTTTTSTVVAPTSVSTLETTTSTESTTAGPDALQVLVFHKTAGFRHDSIPAGIEAIEQIGAVHGFSATATDDASWFTEVGLAGYEAVVFLNTTGDVLDRSQEQAMESFIRSGKGFVGIHSATDTEYEWPWYGELVGAYFESHPAPQSAAMDLAAPEHPAARSLPVRFERFDEWYNFRSVPGADVVVLATLDESSYEGGTMGEHHPIAWAHQYDGGRAFYTAGGHTIESFGEPLFRSHLADGILWSADGD